MLNNLEEIKSISAVVSDIQARHKNKLVVYTSITAGHDALKEPKEIYSDVDYICFSDQRLRSDTKWNIVNYGFQYRDPRRLAKIFKILPHLVLSDYDYSIWVDGNVSLNGNPWELFEKSLCIDDSGIAFFPHTKRNCIYSEANECIRWGKDNSEIIQTQVAKYRGLGYPSNNGLIWGGLILRRHNDEEIKNLMEIWWDEIDTFSVRDQISFNFCTWSQKMNYVYIDRGLLGQYVEIRAHERWVSYGAGWFENLRFFLGRLVMKLAKAKKILPCNVSR